MKPLIQMTRTGIKFLGSTKDLHRLRHEFDEKHCLHFPNLLEKELLEEVTQIVEQARFHKMIHKDIGVETCMGLNKAYRLLLFLTNDSNFVRLIQKITGCDDIGCFNGRVYRMVPKRGHYDSWHSDVKEKERRLLAMSINLSKKIYRGGLLQIRRRNSRKIIYEIANIGFGDAIIFRVDPCLEHRVTGLKGNQAKTALAGWFQLNPKLDAILKKDERHRLSSRNYNRIPHFVIDSEINPTKDAAFIHGGTYTALINLKNGFYYKLDGVGSRIWDLIQEKHSLRSVVKIISGEYDTHPKQIEKDTLDLVKHLSINKLVESKRNGNSSL